MSRLAAIVTVGFFAWAGGNLSAQAPAPSAPPSGPAPKIRFDATAVDLGNVVKGQDAVAEFVYKNIGDAPLKILSAKPG